MSVDYIYDLQYKHFGNTFVRPDVLLLVTKNVRTYAYPAVKLCSVNDHSQMYSGNLGLFLYVQIEQKQASVVL